MSIRGVPPIPMARPVTSRLAPIAGGSVPSAVAGNPEDGAAAARYGRLTNPDLLVAAGDWVEVQSTFLARIRFVPLAEDEDAPIRHVSQQVGFLYLEFVNGFIGKFRKNEPLTYADYRGYLSAPSKGKWHRSRPWYSDYEEISPQKYFGKALAARIKANG
jgi:hypothetical protein